MIDQYEYRWQPAKDFSLIAGSRPTRELSRWSELISLWVRHPPVDAPLQSIRYEIFEDGTAALAWRQRDTQADGFQDETEGRPEVSRLLIGPFGLLTPGIAVALCRTGLPEDLIGRRLGLASADIPLPQVDAGALDILVRREAPALDNQALDEGTGLYKAIATALTAVDTPLSVQLPDRSIVGPLHEGMQGPLMWGLLRTLLPLLGYDCGRGWSFSTFEKPAGEMDTRGLPGIVFRNHVISSKRPANMRTEIVVRPFDKSDLPDRVQYQEFAELLIAAYRRLGGKALAQCLAPLRELPSLEQRIEQAQERLYDALPTEALSAARQDRARGTDSQSTDPAMTQSPESDVPSAGEARWSFDDAAPDGPPAGASAMSSRPAAPNPSLPQPADIPPWYKQLPATPPMSEPPSWQKRMDASEVASSRANRTAPPLPAGGHRQPRSGTGTQPPSSLSNVFDQLDQGPADPRFESALESLWSGTFADLPAERHAVRRRLPENGWYIDALWQHHGARFEETLGKIFERAVTPDLDQPEVAEELAGWVSLPSTPPSVFRALNDAAQALSGWQDLMDQVLVPALGRRWLAEHEFYVAPERAIAAQRQRPPAPGTRARSAHAAVRHEGSLLGRKLSSDAVILLTVFCAILVVLLVLSVTH